MANMFRLLRADEIDARIGTTSQKGVSLLLYKDARCDQNILDETVGPYNWQRKHDRDNANCTVSIWDDVKGQWISKEDVGTESKTEAEKGLASDSFKRACFNWGIGRELYSSPFIWISGNPEDLKRERFSVSDIGYNDFRAIDRLVIRNKAGDVVYSYGDGVPKAKKTAVKREPAPEDKPEEPPILCEVCHKPIQSTTVGTGKVIPPAQVAQITKDKYGSCMCNACAYMVKKSLEENPA